HGPARRGLCEPYAVILEITRFIQVEWPVKSALRVPTTALRGRQVPKSILLPRMPAAAGVASASVHKYPCARGGGLTYNSPLQFLHTVRTWTPQPFMPPPTGT